MNAIHYIGFDVHKKTIAYCVKTADGQIVKKAHCRRSVRSCGGGRSGAKSARGQMVQDSRNHSVERCFYPNRVCEALASPAKTSPFP